MRVTPVPHGLEDVLAKSGPRTTDKLHMSDIYGALYKELEPERYGGAGGPDPLKLEMGLTLESMLETALAERLGGGARPGELTTEHGIVYNPDLVIFNGVTRVGEIKLTWMSCRDVPREPTDGFPPKFAKYFCPDCATPVLKSDLTTVELSDLHIGDSVIGFDEFPTSGFRQLRHSRVTGVASIKKPCVRLILEDGTKFVCSDDHAWLTTLPSDTGGQWRPASRLLKSDQRAGRPRAGNCELLRLFPKWQTNLSEYERGWLAGIFDGEGCLTSGHHGTLRLTVAQNPGTVLDRIIWSLNKDAYRFSVTKNNRSDCRMIHIDTQEQVWRFLAAIRPIRLLGNFGLLKRVGTFHKEPLRVVERIDLGHRTVLGVETTTHTFVAGGFASHNTQMKLYCRALDTPYARLIAFFVNGDYSRGRSGPSHELLAWDIEFSRRELEDEWALCMAFARRKGMIQ